MWGSGGVLAKGVQGLGRRKKGKRKALCMAVSADQILALY